MTTRQQRRQAAYEAIHGPGALLVAIWACFFCAWLISAAWGHPTVQGKTVPGTDGGPASVAIIGTTTTAVSTTSSTGLTTSSTVTTTTVGATTTTTGAGAGNWTDDVVAVWYLDEASGTRVNANGNTTYNLNNLVGTPLNDTTNKMQGAASLVANNADHVRGYPMTAIAAPTGNFTAGCWLRNTDTSGTGTEAFIMGAWDYSAGGWLLAWNDSANRYSTFICKASGVCIVPSMAGGNSSDNAFTHFLGQYDAAADTVSQFVNGAAQGTPVTATDPFAPYDDWFRIGGHQAYPASFQGQIDECFFDDMKLSAASVCRICSCGVDGSLCSCSGTSYTTTGRNAASCGSCSMTGVACNAASPN